MLCSLAQNTQPNAGYAGESASFPLSLCWLRGFGNSKSRTDFLSWEAKQPRISAPSNTFQGKSEFFTACSSSRHCFDHQNRFSDGFITPKIITESSLIPYLPPLNSVLGRFILLKISSEEIKQSSKSATTKSLKKC